MTRLSGSWPEHYDSQQSIQFSTGPGTPRIAGDSASFESHLAQGGINVRLYEAVTSALVGDLEVGLGRGTRNGKLETSFSPTAQTHLTSTQVGT